MKDTVKLKLKQNENSDRWQRLDSNITKSKALCNQLTQSLHQMAGQTERGNIYADSYPCKPVIQI